MWSCGVLLLIIMITIRIMIVILMITILLINIVISILITGCGLGSVLTPRESREMEATAMAARLQEGGSAGLGIRPLYLSLHLSLSLSICVSLSLSLSLYLSLYLSRPTHTQEESLEAQESQEYSHYDPICANIGANSVWQPDPGICTKILHTKILGGKISGETLLF